MRVMVYVILRKSWQCKVLPNCNKSTWVSLAGAQQLTMAAWHGPISDRELRCPFGVREFFGSKAWKLKLKCIYGCHNTVDILTINFQQAEDLSPTLQCCWLENIKLFSAQNVGLVMQCNVVVVHKLFKFEAENMTFESQRKICFTTL